VTYLHLCLCRFGSVMAVRQFGENLIWRTRACWLDLLRRAAPLRRKSDHLPRRTAETTGIMIPNPRPVPARRCPLGPPAQSRLADSILRHTTSTQSRSATRSPRHRDRRGHSER
jgi:hypothetical protein